MIFDITQLKKIRMKLGLTQAEFAKLANISQSMVTKIESGRLDPTYSKVKQIEQVFSSLSHKNEKTADHIMTKKIIQVKSTEKINKLIEVMSKRSISQIPVFNKNNIVGIITESSILKEDLKNIGRRSASNVMEDSPPIISKNTSIEVIKNLLNHYPCVLVKDKGKLEGIITKADLMKNLDV